MQAILRMFTPSDSDRQSGAEANEMYNRMSMPQSPGVEDAAGKAETAVAEKRRAMARSKSIFTSPLGISGTADILRKTLLGQ